MCVFFVVIVRGKGETGDLNLDEIVKSLGMAK